MNEIYWLTRLESINTLFSVIIAVTIIISVLAISFYFISLDDNYMKKEHEIAKKAIKFSLPTLIISTLLFIFTPTTKEALLIWGIGGTIDYIKSNETAKQLPDKCIQALDKFVDEYILDENDNKENNKN